MGRNRGRRRTKRPNQQARRLAQQHIKLDKRYTAVCKHWKRGHCKQGKTCNFAHPGDPDHPTLRLIGVPREFREVEGDETYVKQEPRFTTRYSDPVLVSSNGRSAITVMQLEKQLNPLAMWCEQPNSNTTPNYPFLTDAAYWQEGGDEGLVSAIQEDRGIGGIGGSGGSGGSGESGKEKGEEEEAMDGPPPGLLFFETGNQEDTELGDQRDLGDRREESHIFLLF